MSNKEINLRSYEGVETEQLAECNKGGRAYFLDKMESASADADFIEREIYHGLPLTVCEIGSGNSKLLYALEQRNIIARAVGYEVSKSRWKMAQAFSKLSSSKLVENRNENFLAHPIEEASYDVVVLVDVVFQMISAMDSTSEREALEWIRESLKPHGQVFFELEDYSETLEEIEKKGTLRVWQEYDISDPFEFGLHKISRQGTDIIEVEKVFIKRSSNEKETFTNVLKSYSPKRIIDVLQSAGFQTQICALSKKELAEIEEGNYKRYLYRVIARKE